MKKLLPIGTLGLAGAVGMGLMSFSATTVSAQDGRDAYTKREDAATELVLVDDDDDGDGDDSFTGNSRPTGDNTASNFTAVSRDRDLSRSDKTRDFTYDGPGSRTRDWSDFRTNAGDSSRNDTRSSRLTNDRTRSNFTAVSRDRDLSRGDKTRDFTYDGPGTRTRDWSANVTGRGDGSRNDTRG